MGAAPASRGNKQQGLWMAGFVATRGVGDLWCLWRAGVGLSEQSRRLAGPQTLLLGDKQHCTWSPRGGGSLAGVPYLQENGEGSWQWRYSSPHPPGSDVKAAHTMEPNSRSLHHILLFKFPILHSHKQSYNGHLWMSITLPMSCYFLRKNSSMPNLDGRKQQ